MRHDASESDVLEPGRLVIVDGEVGVWRIERAVDASSWRCFSYVDGHVRVVPRDAVHPCPEGIRAAPADAAEERFVRRGATSPDDRDAHNPSSLRR